VRDRRTPCESARALLGVMNVAFGSDDDDDDDDSDPCALQLCA
jgi:hypothetical protein